MFTYPGEPHAFIGALKRKAGLAPDFWAADLKLSCYRVRKFAAPPVGSSA